MKAEKDIERKIRQKEDEVQHLKDQLLQAQSYLEALQDSLRMIRKTVSAASGDSVRPGSMVHKAREIIRRQGSAMHVSDILRAMGKEVTKKNKVSLSGSLGGYVRQEIVFTRPAPNTFGVIEFNEIIEDDDVPDGFGMGRNL